MITPELITAWLSKEIALPNEQELSSLVKQYPYFLPARYMEAAQLRTTGSNQYYDVAQDYATNLVLFHTITQKEAIPSVAIERLRHNIEEPISNDQATKEEVPVFQPLYTEDYFRQQGVVIDNELPSTFSLGEEKDAKEEDLVTEDPKSLLVMMSFSEWLLHFKTSTQKEKEEEESRRALKNHWQKEKLAAALEEEEEDDEIPEDVFQMAVNSISKEEGLVSESLAEILVKQKKWDKAIEMYRKLSLRNPQKSTYFAAQIEAIQKESNS